MLKLFSIFRNMNEMWSEMSEQAREEYKDYFIRYHNDVARTGVTGKRLKPLAVLPESVITGFEKALLTKVILFRFFKLAFPGLFLFIFVLSANKQYDFYIKSM